MIKNVILILIIRDGHNSELWIESWGLGLVFLRVSFNSIIVPNYIFNVLN